MDRIVWINHAGFELQTEGLRIVCDPWLDGLAFNQSWALLSKTKFKPDDFLGVDYLWFSHEHPDHLVHPIFAAYLRKFEPRSKSCFNVQTMAASPNSVESWASRKCVNYATGNEFELGYGVSITVKSVGDNSFCFIKTPHRTYLNINDCVAANSKAFHEGVAARVGPVDILLELSFLSPTGPVIRTIQPP